MKNYLFSLALAFVLFLGLGTASAQVVPTVYEQYAIELINRARAFPEAEVTRLGASGWGGTPGLNEGLAANTITPAAKQPVAFNPNLITSTRNYAQTLVNNNAFEHGYGGTNVQSRAVAVGYVFSGGWGWGENITLNLSSANPYDITTTIVENNHRDLFIDASVPGRGHRTNIMSPSYREIGIGQATGTNYSYQGGAVRRVIMGVWDYAYSSGNYFLTGVAYNDLVTANSFYTIGEGTGGVTITATPVGGGTVRSATTWATGGYTLLLPNGTYSVTAAGTGVTGTMSLGQVVMNNLNVKKDVLTGDHFGSWAARQFTTTELGDTARTGMDGDFEKDGVSNFLEFALNLNPKLRDASDMVPTTGTKGIPLIRRENLSGAWRLTGEFVRRRASANAGITYTFQFSSDMSAWAGGGTESVTTIDLIWERVRVVDSLANPDIRYGRVLVTLP